jgi:hypothetical protein
MDLLLATRSFSNKPCVPVAKCTTWRPGLCLYTLEPMVIFIYVCKNLRVLSGHLSHSSFNQNNSLKKRKITRDLPLQTPTSLIARFYTFLFLSSITKITIDISNIKLAYFCIVYFKFRNDCTQSSLKLFRALWFLMTLKLIPPNSKKFGLHLFTMTPRMFLESFIITSYTFYDFMSLLSYTFTPDFQKNYI